MRKNCPYLELFCFVFSHIRTEHGESISPYSVRTWENTDQINYEYGHFYVVYINKGKDILQEMEIDLEVEDFDSTISVFKFHQHFSK